jgi:hypothetical protein
MFTLEEATAIGEEIGIFWDEVDFTPEDFLAGLHVELEHGTALSPLVNVTEDDPLLTGKIAWAHLMESGDYYKLLADMEEKFEGGEKEARTATDQLVTLVADAIVDLVCDGDLSSYVTKRPQIKEFYDRHLDEAANKVTDEVYAFIADLARRIVNTNSEKQLVRVNGQVYRVAEDR